MKKKAAIFTKVKNGHQMIQVWYRYYSQFFTDEDIYLLDIGNTDGSIKDFGCNIVKVDPFDFCEDGYLLKSRDLTNSFKTKLLAEYQYVVYSDYDEIIYHPKGLDTYLRSLTADIVSCTGYEIYQTPEEPPIDFQQPILLQRSNWFRCFYYDKPLITKVDFKWNPGYHTIKDRYNPLSDPDLLLLHLHKIDKQRALEINTSNVVKNLIFKKQYFSSLSSDELSKRIKLFKSSAFLPDKFRDVAGDQSIPSLHIEANQITLYYSYYHCCYCENLTFNCGHQNFLIGDQFGAWWRSPQEYVTKISETLKQTQVF